MIKKTKIKEAEAGVRLDQFLTDKLKLSRSQVQKIIKAGGVLVNQKKVTPHYQIKTADLVEMKKLEADQTVLTATPLPKFKLKVVKAAKDYVIVEKPAGIPVHPDSRYSTGTLIDVVQKKYPEIKKIGDASERNRAGVIHRLDKDVSGLIVIARTQKMFDHLKNQFKNREIKKSYTALVHGTMKPESGVINFSIARSKAGPMAARPVKQGGKIAITHYQTIKNFVNYTLLSLQIKTGRTHQIRVHCKALGHAVVGDELYATHGQKTDKVNLNRLFLHSTTLGFTDLAGKYYEFTSKLPNELQDYLTKIK